MDTAESLCILPAPALSTIIQSVSSADRRRLAVTCQALRQLCRQAVQEVLLSQQVMCMCRQCRLLIPNTIDIASVLSRSCLLLLLQDLEDWADQALVAFPCSKQLQLTGVSLGTDCVLELQYTAPVLLHGLGGLQVWCCLLACSS